MSLRSGNWPQVFSWGGFSIGEFCKQGPCPVQQTAAQKAQLEQAKAQTDALHQQIKAQADIEIVKVKAELDAKLAVIDAHVRAIAAEQKARHAEQQHHASLAESALGIAATAQAHDAKMEQMKDTKIKESLPGARKAKDGQHYVGDPQRPGKFLMVVPHG
jgi:hypothetical protein